MRVQAIRDKGFTLAEILIVVAIIGLLASIGLPAWQRSRENAQFNAIGNNLRMLESAKQQWALETKQTSSSIVVWKELAAYLRDNKFPESVAQETYQMSGEGTVTDLVEADGPVFHGKPGGPYTITSF